MTRTGTRGSFAVLALVLVAALLPTGSAAAAVPGWHAGACTPTDANAVTIVVDFQDLGGTTLIRCATGLPAGATGRAALAAAAIPVVGTADDGAAFVCRLAGRPTATQVIPMPGDPTYTESCTTTPPGSAYWSYWSARPAGPWTFNTQGQLSHRVIVGGYEGWSFSHNKTASTNPAPRAATTPGQVKGQGTTTGTRYRGGNPTAGGVSYGVGVQVWRNSAGTMTHVRGIGRITKLSKASAVQADRAALGTSSQLVKQTTAAVNSGSAASAVSVTGWTPVAAGSCVNYRTRAHFSVRWADGAASSFSVLSPLTRVCRPAGS